MRCFNPARGLGFGQPDGRENAEHVGRIDLVYPLVAYGGDHKVLQRRDPLGLVLLVPPGALVLGMDDRGGLGEGGYVQARLALHRERISALARDLAILERLVAGLGERDELEAAQAQVAAPAVHDGAENPTLRTRRLDDEIQPIAVGIAARLLQCPDLDD
jgi:hypothetical protein